MEHLFLLLSQDMNLGLWHTTTAKWDPPISKPTLTDEEIAANKHYVWKIYEYSAYQENNTKSWELRLNDDD